MTNNYKIEFFPRVDIYTKANDGLNKNIVDETIDGFGEESAILKTQNLLVYFGMRDEDGLGALGTLKIKGTVEYKEFSEKVIAHESSDMLFFEAFKYIIYLSSNVRDCDDKIYKIFTIAHELHHVLQDIGFKSERLGTGVLVKYFHLVGTWTNEIYRHIPTEIGAFIKSKKINYKFQGKEKVDFYVDNKIYEIESRINNTRGDIADLELEKSYWQNIRDLDGNCSYDLRREFKNYWKKYEADIEQKVESIRKKKETNKLENNEKVFLDAYEKFIEESRHNLM